MVHFDHKMVMEQWGQAGETSFNNSMDTLARKKKKTIIQLRSKHETSVLIRESIFHESPPAVTSFHSLESLQQKSSRSVPVLVGVFQLDGGAIMSCCVVSLPCCWRWGVEVHLRKHKGLLVQLSEHTTFTFDLNKDDTEEEEEVQPLQFCPKQRQ